MTEVSQPSTPENQPGQTGGEQPAAPAPQSAAVVATGDDEMVQIPKSKLDSLEKSNRDLLSQRDKNHEDFRQTEAQVAYMAQKDDVKEWLSKEEIRAKFPDVEVDDLMDGQLNPDDYEKAAAQVQARIDKAVNRKIDSIEQATTPTLSPKDKAERLKQLRENPGSSNFQEMLALEQAPTS